MLLQCNKSQIYFVCVGWSANIQSAHTQADRRTFHPTIPPHPSLLKSKHHLWSRSSLFPARPRMKEPILRFLPLLQSASHSDSWIDGWNFFHFLPFFKARDTLLQPYSLVEEHTNRDVVMGWGANSYSLNIHSSCVLYTHTHLQEPHSWEVF